MIGIYYGHAKGKTSTCMGATIRAALKEKNVLYIQFLRDDSISTKKALEFFPRITHKLATIQFNEDMISDEGRNAQAKIAFSSLFNEAVITVLTKKFDFLILDGIFDITQSGLIPENEVYEFLSNAPDRLEIICTGITYNQKKFRPLASYAIELKET